MRLCSRSRLRRNAVIALFMYSAFFMYIYGNFLEYIATEERIEINYPEKVLNAEGKSAEMIIDPANINPKRQVTVPVISPTRAIVNQQKIKEIRIGNIKDIRSENKNGARIENKNSDAFKEKNETINKQNKPKTNVNQGKRLKKSYKKDFSYPMEINIKQLIQNIQNGNESHVEPINKHEYNFMFSPDYKCDYDQNNSNSKILILVKSSVQNSERRDTIRSTWGKEFGANIRLVFMLGLPSNGNLKVRVEQSKFNDIVQEDFIDDYRNNTLKMIMSYKWAVTECLSADLLFFVDDDYFVNVGNLQKYAEKVKENEDIFAGTLLGNSVPYRSNGSKWYMPWEQYPFDKYPPYIAGGAYFVSMAIAQKFHLAFPYVKAMHIDDVYLGITAKKIGIAPRQLREIGYRKQSKKALQRLIACHGYGKKENVEAAMKYIEEINKAAQKEVLQAENKPPIFNRPQPLLNNRQPLPKKKVVFPNHRRPPN